MEWCERKDVFSINDFLEFRSCLIARLLREIRQPTIKRWADVVRFEQFGRLQNRDRGRRVGAPDLDGGAYLRNPVLLQVGILRMSLCRSISNYLGPCGVSSQTKHCCRPNQLVVR